MSSTNKTTNLELSQFLGSDSPKWLTDYNADMEKIDTGYQTVKAQADATDLIVGGHTSSISTLQDTTTSQGTAITGLRTDVNGNSGSINTINSLIGNGEPTTTDKTIIGAINEINSDVSEINSDISGAYIPLGIHVTIASITADGVKTNKELIDELHAAVGTYKATLADNVKFRYSGVRLSTGVYNANWDKQLIGKNDSHYATLQNFAAVGTLKARQANFDGNCVFWLEDDIDGNGYTSTSQLAIVPSSGTVFAAYADVYKIL